MSDIEKSYSPLEASALPDVSHEERLQSAGRIQKVGMSGIEMPVLFRGATGPVMQVPAVIDAFVSVDDESAKGIHMSRLYLTLQEVLGQENLNLFTLKKILTKFIDSQKGISESAYLKISFDLAVERKALLSGQPGWRQYPVTLSAKNERGELHFEIGGRVTYSSTCPCSAALSRQLIQNQFSEDFGAQGQVSTDMVYDWLGQKEAIVATPHAQRSFADFLLKVDDSQVAPSPLQVIDLIEETLKTPVQAAVKRQDEQEFARLNASNLMFCEDAARKVKQAFDKDSRILDYWARIEHVESLHPHSATSVITKGLSDGYRA